MDRLQALALRGVVGPDSNSPKAEIERLSRATETASRNDLDQTPSPDRDAGDGDLDRADAALIAKLFGD